MDSIVPYMAGFFDGEGCIRIARRNNGGFDFLMSATQVNVEPLKVFHERYGGMLIVQRKSLQNPKHRDCWVWKISSNASKIALTEMLPCLIVKKPQAIIALKFLEATRDHNRGKSKFLSWEELKVKEEAYEEMKRLKIMIHTAP